MIYLAAPFFSSAQNEILDRVESILSSQSIDYFSPRKQGGLIDKSNPEQMKAVFDSNIKGMMGSDLLLAGVDYKDTGTIWEMGFWYGVHLYPPRPLITYSFSLVRANLMVSHSTTGHLRGHGDVLAFGKHVGDKFNKHGWNCYGEAIATYQFHKMATTE